jgi:hypothetical protein
MRAFDVFRLVLQAFLESRASHQERRFDRRVGEARVRDREVETTTATADAIDYDTQVRPILEARCVVCHACYDAPCQLEREESDCARLQLGFGVRRTDADFWATDDRFNEIPAPVAHRSGSARLGRYENR